MRTRLRLVTAGVEVDVDATTRHAAALARAAGSPALGTRDEADPAGTVPGVRVVLERSRTGFRTGGMATLTRGVATDGDTVVLRSVGGSGFDQAWRVLDDQLLVRSRWTPGPAERAASALRGRYDALRAQVLLHYPALWWAGMRGLAPLHVSVVEIDGVVLALAGPGGVGKSTLVADALAHGARATCDNLAVCDGRTAFGVREALRLSVADGASPTGRRTTHGRREQGWSGQVPSLSPDLVVVVRRGDGPAVRTADPERAHRALVAGTYAAGELRRFWSLTAVLGLATGRGPVLPAVDEVARRLTSRLPCVELELGHTPGRPLRELLAPQLADVRTAGALR